MRKASTISTIALMAAGAMPAATMADTFTFAHSFPPHHTVTTEGYEPWMACVGEKLPGTTFTHFPGGQIVKGPETLDGLVNGLADITAVMIGYVSSKLPLSGVAYLPGLGNDAAHVARAFEKTVRMAPVADEFAANGIHPIWVYSMPVYQLVSSKGELHKPEDFKGKVLRSSGGAMTLTISALGAAPTEMPIGDLYVAMERGTVEGTMLSLSSIKPYNVETLMNAMSTNASLGAYTVAVSMKTDKWQALSEETRTALTECGLQAGERLSAFFDEEGQALTKEFADAGVSMYEFTPEELEWINQAVAPVADDWVKRLEDRGAPAQEALDVYKKLLAETE
ncbi:ABC transporter substrate-binding protein [Pseudooceanicola nanhaiensis]|jgi:TRAP-type C4-dicarboxylate transport system substrate-binding protein|uniref:ABC transporter substrate-binding protein n=1 Tax=Pseudooceanicola nanhaiensis TaxID=375761 RepID=A0A917WMX9_9RHOB|nr:TRAP transporter substrate-binding protein DctP [Pseudooceanicola nanhaiensis]GGM16075.1 ABC transporter substrate-binding protein [Pseudooceanicola nanhaiensis]